MGDTVAEIIDVVASSAPEIRGGLTGRRRKADEQNPSGETQMAADVWADELLEERLTAIDGVGQFASEEREGVIDAGEGNYAVAVDPLDGSSNLKSNNSMGTVLGIYDAELPAKGTEQVAATYVLYGPITTMVVARDDEVTEFVIENDGTQRTVTEDLTLPDEPVVYGFGGRVPDWTDRFADYASEIEAELKLRYGGAMIGDVNQVLTYGGVFGYPELESRPEGKLRLQFEANPMAYILDAAGGASSNGTQSILEAEPAGLHERTPLYLGNEALIERLESTFA
ncbi:class 1 fructose-bisphosphatase [Halorussus halophilus]|uniref:class 1 fructose-bisphosphatase n=1 Tax=Halorussus halophilus TaxID=2650975 RepID=UPI00130106FA|nr:class 1 fructose-bisphosphatase [Halorussus halophilus]